ncbi:MAG: hypothetical protein HOI53_01105 [Francisellaceae bacterium]|nr:hypothetical protein [Francisellaceae bacterium]
MPALPVSVEVMAVRSLQIRLLFSQEGYARGKARRDGASDSTGGYVVLLPHGQALPYTKVQTAKHGYE